MWGVLFTACVILLLLQIAMQMVFTRARTHTHTHTLTHTHSLTHTHTHTRIHTHTPRTQVTDGLPMEPVRHFRVGGYSWGDMATVAKDVPENIRKYYNIK